MSLNEMGDIVLVNTKCRDMMIFLDESLVKLFFIQFVENMVLGIA